MLTVGVFFLLAVAMWLTNKYFGPAELQSNLVVSGAFGIGTERKAYSTGSGGTLNVPILVEYPVGERLGSVRIALSPWPSRATTPAFVPSAGTSVTSSVKRLGNGTVVVSLDNLVLAPSNLGEIGTLAFTVPAGTSATVGLVSGASDPEGTAITAVGLSGGKRTIHLGSPDFFRIEGPGTAVPSPTASGSSLPSSSFRPAAGTPVTTTSPAAADHRLPNVASLLSRSFGIRLKSVPTTSPATGSGLTFLRNAVAGSGSDLRGAAPAGRSPSAPGVDLAVEIQAPSGQVGTGKSFASKAILRNDGAAQATNAKFSLTLPPEMRVVIGSFDREGCSATAQALSCTFPTLRPGQITAVPFDVLPSATGNFPLQATLRADQAETDNADNQTKVTVLVVMTAPSPASPTSAPETTLSPVPRPTAVPVTNLPKTGPMPLGVALMVIGAVLLAFRGKMGVHE